MVGAVSVQAAMCAMTRVFYKDKGKDCLNRGLVQGLYSPHSGPVQALTHMAQVLWASRGAIAPPAGALWVVPLRRHSKAGKHSQLCSAGARLLVQL